MTLHCPVCHHGKTAVTTTFANRGPDRLPERKRYRKCKDCGHTFSTIERLLEADARRILSPAP